MKQTVKRFNVDGDRLNDIFLISDEKYYKHYYILRMDVIFPFAVSTNEGECRVTFSFGSSRSVSKNSELIFEITKMNFKEAPNPDAKKHVAAEIQHALRSLIEEKFDLAMSEREKTPEKSTVTADGDN